MIGTKMSPDLINGLFELVGAFFMSLNCVKLYNDKCVKGIYWPAMVFFATWGIWNLYYYPHLGQLFSLLGGVALTLMNCIWLYQVFYYKVYKNER